MVKNQTKLYVVYKKATVSIKTNRLKVKGWRNIYYANINEKRKSSCMNFKKNRPQKRKLLGIKAYIMVKLSILQEDLTTDLQNT